MFLPLCVFAQNKKFDKLIEKYDVIQYIQGLDNKKPELFWDAIWKNNKTLTKVSKALKKETPCATAAKKSLYDAYISCKSYFDKLVQSDSLEFVADTMILRMELRKIFPDIKMTIINSNEVNAFTTPEGHIYITDSLLLVKDIYYEQLLGICAHEAAHFFLQHTLCEAYDIERELNENKIIAGIASSVNIMANAYAQANGAADNSSWDTLEKNNSSLYEWAKNEAYGRFRYKYSREQEIEADIIAYRFLEWLGEGGQNYIDALKAIGTDEDKYYSDESDHPKISFRINFLEYLSHKHN